jgi:hypothetical protein
MRSARAGSYGAKEASEQHTGSSSARGCATSSREARACRGAEPVSAHRSSGGGIGGLFPSIGYLVPPDGPR